MPIFEPGSAYVGLSAEIHRIINDGMIVALSFVSTETTLPDFAALGKKWRIISLMELGSLLGVLAVFVLIATNGFFVAAEFALVKVRATRIEQLVNEGKGAARVVQYQIHHLDTYIAATQLGITLASLALGWIGEPSLAHLVEPLFAWTGALAEGLSHSLAVAISFFLITAGHIILGELVPKAIALQRDEATVFFVARPLQIFARLLRPFILLMNNTGNAVVRMLGMEAAGESTSVHSPEELEMLVVESRKAGLLDAQEEELLRHVFDFEETEVRQIMIPRAEIVALSATSTFAEIRQIAVRERYTRYPIYEENIDTIIGMLHLKDLLAFSPSKEVESAEESDTFDLRKLLRPVLYVPELTSIGQVFAQMQRQRIHLAMAIDEYGETAGLITLEDIMEELVGEVQDEFDSPKEGVHREVEMLADGSSSVDGLMALVDFRERFGLELEPVHAQTLGGYIQEIEDRIPRVGDTLRVGNYKLHVDEMDGRRVARVRVKQMKEKSEAPGLNSQ